MKRVKAATISLAVALLLCGCRVECDGEFHEYALELSANPDWKGNVDELWFEACQVKHARVAIDWMRFE